MVGAVTSGSTIQSVSTNTQKAEKDVQPVVKAGLEQPAKPNDLVFNADKGTFSGNDAFAIVAEASAKPPQKHSTEALNAYTQNKYAKTAFDLFSSTPTGAQRQLQALLSAQTLQSLIGFSATDAPEATEPEAQETVDANTGATETATESESTGSQSTGSGGSTSTGGTSGGSTGGTTGGSTGGGTGGTSGGTTGPGNGNGNGNGHGYGKGGIKG